jgi:hypothetical protein
MTHAHPNSTGTTTPLASMRRQSQGDELLWADNADALTACVAGRLALWATARVVEQPAGGWRVVDDAGNPVDAHARIPGRTIVGARAASRQIRDDRAIVPPDLHGGTARFDDELRFATREAAEAFVGDQRRRAAWLVMWDLLHPLPGNLDDLNPCTVDLYRSLCLDDTYTPDQRHHKVLKDRLAPDRCDCPYRHGR